MGFISSIFGGGGSKSSSSSSNTTTTTTQNLNVQGAQGPVVAGTGNSQSVSYVSTDHGAVESAFDAIDQVNADTQETLIQLNADVLDFAESSQSQSLDVVDNLNDYTQETLRKLNDKVLGFAKETQTAAYTWAGETVRTEVSQSYDKLVKYSAGAAVAVAIVTALASMRRKKS